MFAAGFKKHSFILVLLELSIGIPILKMNHGLGTVMLQFPSHLNVTDKMWHHLEVRTNGQVSCLFSTLWLSHLHIL